jgi:restriction system protein
MTIIEAIKTVLRDHGEPMTAKECYDAILASGIYEFHAQNPAHVVVMQIRRHCVGIEFPTAAPTKHFKLVGENRFWPLAQAQRSPRVARHRGTRRKKGEKPLDAKALSATLKEIQKLHGNYIQQLKTGVIAELRRLSPAAFETFSKRLLAVYGFEDLHVTKVSGDGGIDGFGKLKVGLAHLNVAFQCKRWTSGSIQRPEIDKFRGASQGEYEQGIFLATTSFSQGAIDASIKRGAIPIVLVDASSIVDLMIGRQFGIQAESLQIPIYALDLVLTDERESILQSMRPSGSH